MRKGTAIITALVLAGPPAGLWLLRATLNRFYSEQEGVITAVLFLVSTYIFLFQTFYLTNESFYLLVKRLQLLIRREHTFWKLTHRLIKIESAAFRGFLDPSDKIRVELDRAVRRFGWGSILVRHGASYIDWKIDDRDQLILSIESATGDVVLTTSKILVPSYDYSQLSAKLSAICDEFERIIRPAEVMSKLEFSFARPNPYFGFFVARLPADLVQTFRCVLKTKDSAGHGCIVTATELEISVNGDNRRAVAEVALSYLTLSQTMTLTGAK